MFAKFQRKVLSALGNPEGLDIPEGRSGRLQLARWLTAPGTPACALTARVIANRLWHHVFDQGLVRTVDNFGVCGERPSHPELLDYLARTLIEQDWSLKDLIRRIVLSRTYRMSTRLMVSACMITR